MCADNVSPGRIQAPAVTAESPPRPVIHPAGR